MQSIQPPPAETPPGYFTLIDVALALGERINHVRMRGVGLLLRERMEEPPKHIRYPSPWHVAGEQIERLTIWPEHLRPLAAKFLSAPMAEVPMPRVWAEQDEAAASSRSEARQPAGKRATGAPTGPVVERIRSAGKGPVVERIRSASKGPIVERVRSASEGPVVERIRSANKGPVVEHVRNGTTGPVVERVRRATPSGSAAPAHRSWNRARGGSGS